MLLIGSLAAAYWLGDFRRPTDVDVLVTPEELSQLLAQPWKSGKQTRSGKYLLTDCQDRQYEVEVEGVLPSTKMLMALGHEQMPDPFGWDIPVYVPALPVLAAIKRSHLPTGVRFEKNIRDYHRLRRACWVPLSVEETAAVQARHAEAVARQDAKISLKKSNEDFFKQSDAAIGRIMEHDQIHRLIAFGDKPWFEKLKLDPSQAMLHRPLFEALPFASQIEVALEEAMAIGIERVMLVVPKAQPRDGLEYGLRRICTNLCKGWFRDFAIDNWPALRACQGEFNTAWHKVKEHINAVHNA